MFANVTSDEFIRQGPNLTAPIFSRGSKSASVSHGIPLLGQSVRVGLTKVEKSIRTHLSAGMGILKVAALVGVSREMTLVEAV
jgi:hypothetical protein